MGTLDKFDCATLNELQTDRRFGNAGEVLRALGEGVSTMDRHPLVFI